MHVDYLWIAAVIFVLLLLPWTIRILREYERGVGFTLGGFGGVRGPGLIPPMPRGPADGANELANRRAGGAEPGRHHPG
jgi:hypothetical protein